MAIFNRFPRLTRFTLGFLAGRAAVRRHALGEIGKTYFAELTSIPFPCLRPGQIIGDIARYTAEAVVNVVLAMATGRKYPENHVYFEKRAEDPIPPRKDLAKEMDMTPTHDRFPTHNHFRTDDEFWDYLDKFWRDKGDPRPGNDEKPDNPDNDDDNSPEKPRDPS